MATIVFIPNGETESAVHTRVVPPLVSEVGVAGQRTADHMGWGWGWDGGGAWFMFSLMAIFWVGVIALGWWAIASSNRRHESAREPPLDVARHRYARGEISAEEFERLKRDLS